MAFSNFVEDYTCLVPETTATSLNRLGPEGGELCLCVEEGRAEREETPES